MTSYERKKKTEQFLTENDIPFIDHLPQIEEEDEARIRNPQDIAKRILILTYLSYVAEVQDAKEKVVEYLKSEDLWESVTPDEKTLFQKQLTDKEKINISWRSEATWLMLWAINKVDDLRFPNTEVIISDILERLPEFMSSTREFIQTATIRKTSELLDASDLIYRLHWAVRDAALNGKNLEILNSSIVSERHYAINWVTFYADDWDDISTDT